ncbi:hypothetical protein GGI07_002987 [Coemansia sp. Benny D115]|nr:hypothetical protein GGI07_002987 [Coemansia sp. Benny D115]
MSSAGKDVVLESAPTAQDSIETPIAAASEVASPIAEVAPTSQSTRGSIISNSSKAAVNTKIDPAREEAAAESVMGSNSTKDSSIAENKMAGPTSNKEDEVEDDAADRDEKNLEMEKSVLGSMPLQRMILTMSSLAMSVFIGSLDQTIVAGSLPTIAKQFDALGSVSWIATGFLLASTAMQPLYGRLSDIFGRIETLITGLLIFLAGSAIAGAAKSIGMLIAGRVVQGLGASALMSLVMVIVSDISVERERGKVTSVFSAIWAASSVLGPVLGGVFTESKGGWPWVFYFSLPVGGLAGIFIVMFLHLPRPEGSFREKLKRVDFLGIVILVGGIVMILLALSFGGDSHPWDSPMVLCLLIFGVVTVGLFVLVEWKVPAEPIMPLRLFKNRNVGLALLQQVFVGAVMFGPTFYIPIYFSVIMNSSAISSGLHLLPFILPITFFSVLSGFIVYKTGRYREQQWVGGALLTTGITLLILLDESTSTGRSIGIMLPAGIGMGLLLQPMLLTLQTSIQRRDMATGTTLFVAIRSLGGSIGLAVFQTVQQNSLTPKLEAVARQFPKFAELVAKTADNQALIYSDAVSAELRYALVQAYVKSLRSVFYAMIPFAGMVFLLPLFIRHIPLRTSGPRAKMASDSSSTSLSEKQNVDKASV